MPIQLKDYSWSQTDTHISLTVYQLPVALVKGGVSGIDLHVSDLYVKINAPPYFFELDLLHPIDDQLPTVKSDQDTNSSKFISPNVFYEDAPAVISKSEVQKTTPTLKIETMRQAVDMKTSTVMHVESNQIILTLTKKEKNLQWSDICFKPDATLSRIEAQRVLKERRDGSDQRRIAHIEQVRSARRVAEQAQKSFLTRHQIQVERQERERIEARKKELAENASNDLASWSKNASGMVAARIEPVPEEPVDVWEENILDDPEPVKESQPEPAPIPAPVPSVPALNLPRRTKPLPPVRGPRSIQVQFTSRDWDTMPDGPSRAARESEDKKRKMFLEQQKKLEYANKALSTVHSDQIETLMNKAKDFYERGDFESARLAYDAILQREPENLTALSNRSACCMQLGQPRAALIDLDTAIICIQSQLQLLTGDGTTERPYRTDLDLKSSLPKEMLKHAVSDNDKVILLRQKQMKWRMRRAVIYRALGDDQRALKEYENIIQSEPSATDARAEAQVLATSLGLNITA